MFVIILSSSEKIGRKISAYDGLFRFGLEDIVSKHAHERHNKIDRKEYVLLLLSARVEDSLELIWYRFKFCG